MNIKRKSTLAVKQVVNSDEFKSYLVGYKVNAISLDELLEVILYMLKRKKIK